MRALENPPEEDQILDPFKQTGKQTVHIPSVNLFIEERDQWIKLHKEADEKGDMTAFSLSKMTKRVLSSIIKARVALASQRLLLPPDVPGDQEVEGETLSWYTEAVTILAHSRMYSMLSKPGCLAPVLGRAEVVLDFDIEELENGGLHFKPEYSENDGPDESLTRVKYYKAGSIYIAASRPATPTASMIESYPEAYGEPFIEGGFATARPILKQSVWRGEVA